MYTERYTYLLAHGGYEGIAGANEQMYDRLVDPYEQHPIRRGEGQDDLLDQFKAQLVRHLEEVGDPFMTEVWQVPYDQVDWTPYRSKIAENYIGPTPDGLVSWTGAADDGLWSSFENWNMGQLPVATGQVEWSTGATVNVDIPVTQAYYRVAPTARGNVTFGGPGQMTLDRISDGSNGPGLSNQSATGVAMQFDTDFVVNDSGGDTRTQIETTGSANNIIRFNGAVTLITGMELKGGDGSIQFAGALLGAASLRITDVVHFLSGHDSSAYGNNIVLLGGSTLAIESGATVLSSVRRFQYNGDSDLILNGENVVNGAYVNANGHTITIDVNADNTNFGHLTFSGKFTTITLDLTGGNRIWFADSSSQNWSAGGSITITGFEEGLVRFGTSQYGLAEDQLNLIGLSGSSVPLYLDYHGYLTASDPAADPVLDLFPSAVRSLDSWYNVGWIASGWIHTAQFPWLLSMEHGWWWAGAASAQAYWFYDIRLGWIYTSPTLPNFYYRANSGAWLFHQPDSGVYGADRWFYNYLTFTWEVI